MPLQRLWICKTHPKEFYLNLKVQYFVKVVECMGPVSLEKNYENKFAYL